MYLFFFAICNENFLLLRISMIKQFKTEIFSNNPTKNNCVFAACIQSQQDDLETPLTGQNMEISFIVFYVFRLLDRRTKSGIFFYS